MYLVAFLLLFFFVVYVVIISYKALISSLFTDISIDLARAMASHKEEKLIGLLT